MRAQCARCATTASSLAMLTCLPSAKNRRLVLKMKIAALFVLAVVLLAREAASQPTEPVSLLAIGNYI